MQCDIYVREKNGIREIRIPILPEEISFKSGDATVITYDIMGLGVVEVPSGTELDGWSWKSEFPGFWRGADPIVRGKWNRPSEYDSILRDWKKNGTELNLLCTGWPINADVYLKEYHPSAAGPYGDIYYEIGFVEARQVTVTTIKQKGSIAKEPFRTTQKPSFVTIKKGDTLWGIAKVCLGDGKMWPEIYQANKHIIESTAKQHGKKGSDNGHWIYPGVTLSIPTPTSIT